MSPQLEYLNLTVLLHRLVSLGLGDSELADQLRDEMDPLWRQLTEAQIRAVGEVGARLNAERDIQTAVTTERIEELDRMLQHLAARYRKEKEQEEAGG